MKRTVKLLSLIPLLATLLQAAPAWAGDAEDADDQVLVARYAVLVGGREAGSAPTSSGVLSRQELTDLLLRWQPESDNAEVRQAFALNEIGELARQASQLPLEGGTVSGFYALGDARYEIGLRIRPAGGGDVGGDGSAGELAIAAEIRRDGELLSSPRIHTSLGERAILTTTVNGGSFLFVVVEVDALSEKELFRRGLRHSWRQDFLLVDGEEVTAPVAIDKPQPTYPEEARKAKQQGKVVLRLVIDEDGEVADVEVIEGLPYGLTEAAIEAARRWRFTPAHMDGEPVAVLYIITINFRLE
jgi:TonB family protein